MKEDITTLKWQRDIQQRLGGKKCLIGKAVARLAVVWLFHAELSKSRRETRGFCPFSNSTTQERRTVTKIGVHPSLGRGLSPWFVRRKRRTSGPGFLGERLLLSLARGLLRLDLSAALSAFRDLWQATKSRVAALLWICGGTQVKLLRLRRRRFPQQAYLPRDGEGWGSTPGKKTRMRERALPSMGFPDK